MFIKLYISWNVDPALYEGIISLRYYSIFFAISFLLGFYIVKKMYINESAPIEWMDKKLVYAVLGTIIGARLGHVFFYEWDYYAENLMEIPMVWKGGLASHGAAVALIFSMWIYSKKVTKKHTLWALDKLVIAVALAGGFIRMGNLMNSEIVGLRTDQPVGLFFEDASSKQVASVFRIEQESVNFFDTGVDTLIEGIRYPINNLSLTIPGIALDSVSQHNYIQSQLVPFIDYYSLAYRDALKQELNNAITVERQESERVEKISSFLNGLNENHFFTTSKSYDVNVLENQVVIPIYIIPRTPTQLYEAIAYWFTFLFLFWAYWKRNWYTFQGRLFGVFLSFMFTARFVIEFFKEHQTLGDESVVNMGQYLSIPLIILGLYYWVNSKKSVTN